MAKTPTAKAVFRALNTRIGPNLSHNDLAIIARSELQQKRWVGLRNPPVELEKVMATEYYKDGESAVTLFAAEQEDKWPGIGEIFAPLAVHLTAAIGYVISGQPSEKMRETVGLNEIDCRVVSACDKNGFNPLWKWAKAEKFAARRERYADIMQERIEKGTAKPVVIRTSRDHDEIRMVTQHSDTLLVKANEFEREDRREAKGATNIGTQVVYNVQLPAYLAQPPAKPEKVIEATEETQ